MLVSRSDFSEVMPEILAKLEAASFVSFDAEYTGLKGEDGEQTSLFDTTAQRYEILRRVVLSNSAPQFGIAIFRRMCGPEYVSEQTYSVDAYSMYVSEPSFGDFNMGRVKASLDVDCCQFLNGIKFDFNQWFTQSVPYLNQNKVRELEEYLKKNPNILRNPGRNSSLVDYISAKEVGEEITEKVMQKVVEKLRGFSRIVDVISRRRIPVVGHNMALDLMYFFHLFCKDLPEQYGTFKSEVVNFLPSIYDTKYMTIRCRKNLDHPALSHAKKNIDSLKCSGLYVIYKTSSEVVDKFSPKCVLTNTCAHFSTALEIGKSKDLEDEENSPLCHEPSFDACVTGIVFLNLAHIACSISKSLLTEDKAPTFEEVMKYVRHWQDQVFVARATVMTMCLKGDDPRPNRSWVKIVSKKKQTLCVLNVMSELRSDPDIQRQLFGVDYQQVAPDEIILAVSRVQCANDLCEKLQEMGYEANRIMIPWDKKRYENVDSCKTDYVYDTGRNKFLS